MLKCKLIILSIFVLTACKSFAQNKEAKDTCMVVLPIKVYISDNGFHFISNCTIKKFSLAIFNLEGKRVFRSKKLRQNKISYFIKLWNYKTGEYKWQIKYTMLLNGEAVVKETFGRAEFLN